MVMCYHTGTIFALTTGELLFGNLFRGGFLGVNVFFVLSGFVMHWMHGHEFGQAGKVPVFVKKRLARIFPIYLVVVLAKIVKDRTLPEGLVLFSAALLIPYPHVPFINVAWTLSYELFFYVALACMIALPRGWLTLLPPAVLLFFALCPSPVQPSADFWDTLMAFPFNLHLMEFLFGMGVGWLARRWTLSGRGALWLALGGGVAFAGFFIWATGLSVDFGVLPMGQAYELAEIRTNELFKQAVWLMGIPFSALLLGLVLAETASGARRIPGLDWLGDISYSLYLVHGFVISFLLQNREVSAMLQAQQWLVFLPMLVAVGSAAACHYLLEKPLIKWLKPWASKR